MCVRALQCVECQSYKGIGSHYNVLVGGGAAFKWLAQLCRMVHVGVVPVFQWSQELLDGERGHPSQKVE